MSYAFEQEAQNDFYDIAMHLCFTDGRSPLLISSRVMTAAVTKDKRRPGFAPSTHFHSSPPAQPQASQGD
jgi:hypothetical protein